MPTIKKEIDQIKIQATNLASADRLSVWILLGGMILLPFVFFPLTGFSLAISKKYFLLALVVTVFVFWLVGRLQEGSLRLPKSIILLLAGLLPFVFLLSAIFSGNPRHSLVGSLYQSGTALMMLVLVGLLFLSAVLFNNRSRLLNFFMALSLSGSLLGLYLLVRFFLGPWLPQVIITYLPISLIGVWYETGVFFGLVTIVNLILLEKLDLTQAYLIKKLIISGLVVNLLVLILINFSLVWWAVGLVALGLFIVANLSTFKPEGGFEIKKIFKPAFSVLIIALLFIVLGGPNGVIGSQVNSIYNKFEFNFLEIRPGFNSTLIVLTETIKDKPILGVGPNNFQNAWSNYRPRFVNELPYWNIGFSNSFGIVPTFMVTTGLVGLLAFLAFFGVLLFSLGQGLIASFKQTETVNQTLIILSGLTTLYAWSMLIFYTPDAYGLPFAFFATGLWLASLSAIKIIDVKTIKFSNKPKFHLVTILLIVVSLLVSLVCAYSLIQRFWSLIIFTEATKSVSLGQINDANNLLAKAIQANNKNPLYFRLLASLKLEELNQLLSRTDGAPEEIMPQVQQIIDAGVASAMRAVALNPLDYQNYLALGQVYEFLSVLKINEAYDRAKETYTKALVLNPNNPEIYLNLARLEINQTNFEAARNYLDQALAVKSNFVSSIILLAQLDVQDGNSTEAIARLKEASLKNPNDVNLLFQLGLLSYRSSDHLEAIKALKQALTLSPSGINSNISYFLGLSLAALGETKEAIEQFKLIESYNPDNAEVKQILSNLRSGLPALTGLGIEDGNLEKPDLNEEESVQTEEEVEVDEDLELIEN